MIIDIEELKKELAAGTLLEHRHTNVECKESWSQDVGRKISANANKTGKEPCWVVIGANKDGKVANKDEGWLKKTEEEVSQHLNQYLDPFQACGRIVTWRCNGGWVLVIPITPPGAVVFWNHKAYKSSSTTVAEMDPPEIMERMVSLPGLEDYSAQPCEHCAYDASLVKRFTECIVNERRDETHFSDLLKPGAEADSILDVLKIRNRRVAHILFGKCPFRVVYHNESGDPVKQEQFFGLYRLLDHEFHSHIQEWTKNQISQHGTPYPPKAISEALANAVAHAAYFEHDGDIIVELFSDHLAISNLCLRESTFFANKWFSRSHKTTNKLLMEALRVAGLVDELGRGKNVIFRESLANGKRAPEVHIERAGRYSRWRLLLHDGTKDERQLRLLKRLRDHYTDEHKAMIANALVLWSDKPISEIRRFVDDESLPAFGEVLEGTQGPVFYYARDDKVYLTRWARILLEEGKDSKQLNEAEETHLYEVAYAVQMRYHQGIITPEDVRRLGHIGSSTSENSLVSKLLKKWTQEGKLEKIGHGKYKFRQEAAPAELSTLWQRLTEEGK